MHIVLGAVARGMAAACTALMLQFGVEKREVHQPIGTRRRLGVSGRKPSRGPPPLQQLPKRISRVWGPVAALPQRPTRSGAASARWLRSGRAAARAGPRGAPSCPLRRAPTVPRGAPSASPAAPQWGQRVRAAQARSPGKAGASRCHPVPPRTAFCRHHCVREPAGAGLAPVRSSPRIGTGVGLSGGRRNWGGVCPLCAPFDAWAQVGPGSAPHAHGPTGYVNPRETRSIFH